MPTQRDADMLIQRDAQHLSIEGAHAAGHCIEAFVLMASRQRRRSEIDVWSRSIHMAVRFALNYAAAEISTYLEQLLDELAIGFSLDDYICTAAHLYRTQHLTSRLNDIDKTVHHLAETFFCGWQEVFADGPWHDLVIRLAQVHDDDEPPGIDELLKLTLRYGPPDLLKWRAAVQQLVNCHDRLSLFAAFADVEEDLDPFERQLQDLANRIAHEQQLEEDIRNGK
jgi:hypothetical protein